MRVNTSRGVLAGQEYTEAWVDMVTGDMSTAATTRVTVKVPGWNEAFALATLRDRLSLARSFVAGELFREIDGER